MDHLPTRRRRAVLAHLIDKLSTKGSWNGETHIQKSVYFLMKATEVPVGFEFILYKHGPYSFDLHTELIWMKATDLIKAEPKGHYGPSFRLGRLGRAMLKRFPKTIKEFSDRIDFIADELGDKRVVELERLATALLISRDFGTNTEDPARSVNKLKPHITVEEAREAIQQVNGIITRARKLGFTQAGNATT